MILNSQRPWKPAADTRHLSVVAGYLWVTSARGGEDFILGPGQSLALKGKGWVAQALGQIPCEIVTSEVVPRRTPPEAPARGLASSHWKPA